MTRSVIRLVGLRLPLAEIQSPGQEQASLARLICRRAGVSPQDLLGVEWIKKSLDARDKARPAFVYVVDATFRKSVRGERPSFPAIPTLPTGSRRDPRPVVVGAGPAGLFAALTLVQAGLSPIVLEQGRPVEERSRDVERFWSDGVLDPASNIQFGEGGAGAFSDGKLTSRSKDSRSSHVLRVFVECGAQPEILYWYRPHIGSDRLPGVIANLRRRIQAGGGEFLYQSRLVGLTRTGGQLRSLTVQAGPQQKEFETDRAILAVGHSARPLYRTLAGLGLAMEAKPFAVGLRIQHPQALIDRDQYGTFAGHPLLGAADYQLTYTDETTGRGCYTFCNCPGGHIVNASSEPGALVVNGMSLAARDSGWANSAAVVQVFPGRDYGKDPLDGLAFQEQLEAAAFTAGGGEYCVPVTTIQDFLGQPESSLLDGLAGPAKQIKTPAWRWGDLRAVLGEELSASLQRALLHWDRQLPGFAGAGLLAAVESRTSAPLRLLRGEDGASLNCRGLYPAGEGAGYAGGIVSSAIDGIRAAQALLEQSGGSVPTLRSGV